ncbi:MAG TPA: peptidase, partial [Thermoguttaceae bacterium]
AWDIALAHPDLWAGVIPISALADRYCSLYWENAKYLPFYVILGELDGAKLTKNARDLDRYFKHGYNATVIEYEGRGHDDFHEEILKIFDWMGRFRRDFFPREFTCSTMRLWDSFFWWVELDGMPPKSLVDPTQWPPPSGTRPLQVSGSITNNNIYIRTGSSQVSLWLSPKMIDFDRQINIVVNGQRVNNQEPFFKPDLNIILEDVRTRGDRQHPFWSRLDSPTGRVQKY